MYLYCMTSKQHKCPYKFRFNAGASNCYNKQLAKELSLALKCIKRHFKNYCKLIEKRTGICYYWSVDNSYVLINKISDIKTARSIKTFDFSTPYTNLPLAGIYDSLRSLIIWLIPIEKIYISSLMGVFSNKYLEYQWVVMHPFIAALYLSWCEYCYMTKIVKNDYAMAKLLSYNCRYLDDICTVNFKYFGDIAKYIYDSTLLLEGSACSYKQDTFLDLYIRDVDGKFVTGIYHKVDDFNFEVINYPFPQNNIHCMLGHTTFYSQHIRFIRLCNNINDFLFRGKRSSSTLVKRGYIHSLLFKYFKRFCLASK